MPARIACIAVATSKKPPKSRSKRRNRTLDAFAIAQKLNPEPVTNSHRLGESDDFADATQRKRRKLAVNQEGSQYENGANLDSPSGSDGDGNRWNVGQVDAEDDSEIDSDAAFTDGDEEKFEDFVFRGGSGQKKGRTVNGLRKAEEEWNGISGDEQSIGSEDGASSLGDEAIDLAQVLDAEESDAASGAQLRNRTGASRSSWDMEATDSETDGEEEDDDSEEVSVVSSSDEADEAGGEELDSERMQQLHRLIETLPTDTAGYRVRSSEVNPIELQQPSISGAHTTAKVTVDDLLSTITDRKMKKSLLSLMPQGSGSGKKDRMERLQPPLPQRQQDRLGRIAASGKAKDTLDRWVQTVTQNRRADHLSFPIRYDDEDESQGLNGFLGPWNSKPLTNLETTINDILIESGMAGSTKTVERQIQAFENLQSKKLGEEEILAKRSELRKARDLLFREEIRAKRIKKIKSKTYRRMRRRERDGIAEEEREAFAAAGIEAPENERELNERRRAEQRMGAKHKDSKWAKSVKRSGQVVWDDEARASITDSAKRREDLERRLEGKKPRSDEPGGNETSSSRESEGDSSTDDDSDEGEKSLPKALERELKRDYSVPGNGMSSRLNSMKFMVRAQASLKEQNDQNLQDLKHEIYKEAKSAKSDESADEDARLQGRRSFGPNNIDRTTKKKADVDKMLKQRGEFEEFSDEDDTNERSEVENEVVVRHESSTSAKRETKAGNIPCPKKKEKRSVKSIIKEDQKPKVNFPGALESNPWLVPASSKKKKKPFSVPQSAEEAKIEDQRTLVVDDADVNGNQSDSNQNQEVCETSKEDLPLRREHFHTALNESQVDGEDLSDDEMADTPLVLPSNDLVKRAFAGDDVVADFEKEKKAITVEDGQHIIDNNLPGWGSWTGAGVARYQRSLEQIKSLTKASGPKLDKRKDAKLDRVIINEKRVKKNVKFMASSLPHPFETKQQYERSLSFPVGPEWTTRDTFFTATKPKVLVKPNMIISPLEKPLV